MLTVRNPLVHLVWSGWTLPLLTIGSIWVGTCRVRPLPIITTADRRLTIDLGVEGSVMVWASVARVIAVDNGRHSQKATDTMAVGVEKIFLFRTVAVA